jgi:hypothetical protein
MEWFDDLGPLCKGLQPPWRAIRCSSTGRSIACGVQHYLGPFKATDVFSARLRIATLTNNKSSINLQVRLRMGPTKGTYFL